MKKIFLTIMLIAFFAVPAVSYALSDAQVNAITSLLNAFGADTTVVTQIRNVLLGDDSGSNNISTNNSYGVDYDILLTEPSSNDVFTLGENIVFEWETEDIAANSLVDITLINGALQYRIAQMQNSGFYVWDNGGYTASGVFVPEGTYAIKTCAVVGAMRVCDTIGGVSIVKDDIDGSIGYGNYDNSDTSNNPKNNSVSTPSIKVDGVWGEYHPGDTVSITWDSVGVPKNNPIDIYISKEKGFVVVSDTENDGLYNYTIPENIPEGDYTIFVGSYDTEPLVEGSGYPLKIVNPEAGDPLINVSGAWGYRHPGDDVSIVWTSENIPTDASIDIELWGANKYTVVRGIKNEGLYNYTIPENLPEDTYTVVVEATYGDNSFVRGKGHSLNVVNPEVGEPSITVSGHQGERYPGHTVSFAWNSFNVPLDASIDIELWGANKYTVVRGTINDGEYIYKLPENLPEDTYTVVVEATYGDNSFVRGKGHSLNVVVRDVTTSFRGDVSLDGKITSYDAGLIAGFVSGNSTLTDYQQELSDVNRDTRITMLDARIVNAHAIGIVEQIPARDLIYGDVNFDGSVTSHDAALVSQHINGTELLSAKAQLVADVDDSGEINSIDAEKILEYSIGLRSSFGFVEETQKKSQFATAVYAIENAFKVVVKSLFGR